MKNLITQIACTMLLMAFVITFVSLGNTNIRIAQIYKLAEEVKVDKELSPQLREKISNIAGCSAEEVHTRGDDDNKVIVINIRNVISPANFWHISPDKNCVELEIGID